MFILHSVDSVRSWSTTQVAEWAKDTVKPSPQNIQKLVDNEITGLFEFMFNYLILRRRSADKN